MLSKEALEEQRTIIIPMKENGNSPPELGAPTGCSHQALYPSWNNWKKSSNKETSIEVQRYGRAYGYGRTLTKAEEQEIPKGIIDEYPDQMKRDFALWTGEEVKLMIRQKYDMDMPIRTI
ncbi:hypothetical protein Holit_03309 [Hollandina sp. SP2]